MIRTSALISKVIRPLITINRYLQKFLFSIDRKFGQGFSAESHNEKVIRSTISHDMAMDHDEMYFADQYWLHVENGLNSFDFEEGALFLDLGCGQGRMTGRLAKWCRHEKHEVFGVDFSRTAVEQARNSVAGQGLGNVNFKVGDLLEYLNSQPDECVSCVLLLEVLIFHPEYNAVLSEVKRVLRKPGILFLSVRSEYFYALSLVQGGMFENADLLLKERTGRLYGSDVCFNWHTVGEVSEILTENHGFKVHDVVGIGCCSGIANDPLASIVRPSQLGESDKKILMEIECKVGRTVPDGGRYMLFTAEK